jgi:serine/threonine protein kinase
VLAPDTLIHERYRVVRLIGRGGMGAVYEAQDQRLGTAVALKQTLAEGGALAEAFAREARLLAALHHQALPKVTDYFSDPHGQFLVMEFFAGPDLATALARRGRPFAPADVLGWADQILSALAYLHRQHPPVIHRDIKPQNLKLTSEGQIVLLDFGLAKGQTGTARGEVSLYGYSPNYAPPEQIDASGTNARSDLYALAATLYQLLTGEPPAAALARLSALGRGHPDPLQPPRAHAPHLPPALEAALLRALALRREERPGSAEELRAELARIAQALAPAPPEAPAEKPAPAPEELLEPTQIVPSAVWPPGEPGSTSTTSRRRTIQQQAGLSWPQLRRSAQVQTDTFLREARGTPQRPGPFLADAYARRSAAEQRLAEFLTGEAQALLLVGDSGVGKTSLLCQWTLDLLAGEHAVFFYRCGSSLALEVEREIARDLLLEPQDDLLAHLERVAELAAGAGRQFVLIFDAINEFRSGTQAGPEALLRQLDALVRHLPERHTRVVLSCSTPIWRQLERLGTGQLYWSRYFQPDDEPLLRLGRFTPEEAALAYGRYRELFRLSTSFEALPAGLRERLRSPLLLRMLAETYRERPEPIAHEALALGIFRSYYEQRVRQRRDQRFAETLALELLRQRRAALPVDLLGQHEQLGPEVLREDSDSSYYRLLDAGILTEQSGGAFEGELAGFTYARVGAYVLARALLRLAQVPADLMATLADLLHGARAFPLAWDTARTILLMYKAPDIPAELARSTDVELRELVVASLTERHADEPAGAAELIRLLLQGDSEEARRTGLKAAYYIGPRARELFLWAATKGAPELRRATRDTLYLIWRSDPDFTYGLLRDLVGRIGLGALLDMRNLVEFVIDLSVTIYINHCEQPEVIRQTADLFYDLARNRLRMDLLNTALLGQTVEALIFQAVAAAFARPIMDTVLLSELMPAERFFALPLERRALLKRIAAFLDPDSDIGAARAVLEELLGAEAIFFNIAGALALAVHAWRYPEKTARLLRELFERLPGDGRVWVLLSLCVLQPDTPPAWTGLLEEWTARLFAENPAQVYGGSGLLGLLDILLLPLGLAYAKQQPAMPLFEQLIQDGLLRSDWRQVERVIAGLGAVGFYKPRSVFETLRAALPDLGDTRVRGALVRPLATMRLLHLDEVDIFLGQIGADEQFQRQVAAATDMDQIRRYIYWLGLYNNAVHQSLFYPRMRRQLAAGGLMLLAESSSPQDFTARYAAVAIRMLRESGFRLEEWTKPE